MSNKPFLKFFLGFTLAAIILFSIYVLLVRSGKITGATFDISIFITQYIVTLLISFGLLKALSFQSQHFVPLIILSVVVKLIIYVVFIFVIINLSPHSAVPNVILFLSIYLIFTALAIGMLTPVISRQRKESHTPH